MGVKTLTVTVCNNAKELGQRAARFSADIINRSIREKGHARIVLSTGMSQFETLEALVKEEIDWSKVEMFHLDEYVALPETHKASFRKYLKERFLAFAPVKKAHLISGEGDLKEQIAELTREIRRDDIDIGLIGIGENAHIAFNDPPADFETTDAYLVVNLNETCKKQQMGEGWFPTLDDVPKQAISMSVYQIMQCKCIVSCVPHQVKAKAIYDMMNNNLSNAVPATMLKTHEDVHLFLDTESASLLNR